MFVPRCGILALWTSLTLWAAPPLTTIQDVLYKADGTAFNGTLFIEWKSFVAVDNSYIAGHSLTVPVVKGILRVQLVPTGDATPPTSYSVRYNSEGKIQFEETWVVPPSSTALKIKDVRVAPLAVISPPAATEVQESDVVGLLADLEIRPVKGTGYGSSRAAYIGATGALEAVIGDAADCVRVDGTSGPCGAEPAFVDGETPAGLVNGSNTTFTLADTPNPLTSLTLFRNGLLQMQTLDYTVSGNVITFATASVPQTGDVLLASYRLAYSGRSRGQARGALDGRPPGPSVAAGVISDANLAGTARRGDLIVAQGASPANLGAAAARAGRPLPDVERRRRSVEHLPVHGLPARRHPLRGPHRKPGAKQRPVGLEQREPEALGGQQSGAGDPVPL